MREQLNCPNCGAPITSEQCEYCGTLFYDFANIELFKPSYIRLRVNDKLVIMKAMPTCINMTLEPARIQCNYPSMKMNVEFRSMADENGILYKTFGEGKE